MEELLIELSKDITQEIYKRLFIFFIIYIIFILAIRWVVCWYWKINKRTELLEQIAEQTNRQIYKQNEIILLQERQIELMKNQISKMDQIITNTTINPTVPIREDERTEN